MKTIYRTIAESLQAGEPMVLVTLIEQNGSTPRTAGAKMLVLRTMSGLDNTSVNGNTSSHDKTAIVGTIGGGLYEAKAIDLAQELYKAHASGIATEPATKRALVVLFDLQGSATPTDMDMICGGALRLLIEYIPATKVNSNIYESITEAESTGQACTIITRITTQASVQASVQTLEYAKNLQSDIEVSKEMQYAVEADTSLYFANVVSTPDLASNIPNAVKVFAQTMDHHAAHTYLDAGYEYILEALHAPYVLHIFGAGHVSCELAKIADYLGFMSIAIDDRAEFANAERFPDATPLVLDALDYAQIIEYFTTRTIGAHDGVIIVTRGHARDRDVLAAALETQAGYIGMIGSKAKRQATYAHLAKSGYAEGSFDRIHSPIGLSIGAQTPEEIAISISAELIQWRAGRL